MVSKVVQRRTEICPAPDSQLSGSRQKSVWRQTAKALAFREGHRSDPCQDPQPTVWDIYIYRSVTRFLGKETIGSIEGLVIREYYG